MDDVQVAGMMRAAGALIYQVYIYLVAKAGNPPEALLAAAEAMALAGGVPSAGAPPAATTNVDGALVGGRKLGDITLDPVVPAGTPGTVMLPVTGHVVSLARVKDGETIVGYMLRVADQVHGNPGSISFNMIPPGWSVDGSDWPEKADRYFNQRAYMTPEERAKEEAKEDAEAADWAVVGQRIAEQRRG